MSTKIREINNDLISITKSVVVHTTKYSKFGGYEGTVDIYTMDIAKDLYNAGYRKQKEGKWIKDNNKRTCSLCGYLYYSNNDNFNYCPNCGAEMRGNGIK